MDRLLINRVLKSINEEIILIYYISLKTGYYFYVLGSSNFIYKIIINKNYQKCNCEDYFKTKFCKHICFVLFKVLKVYKIILSNFELKLNNDHLLDTEFFKTKIFPKLDWFFIKKNFKNIKKYIRSNFFNKDYYNKFNDFYHQFHYLIYKKIEPTKNECVICISEMDEGIKCPVCKKFYHTHCLIKWLNKNESKNCPTCRSDYWNLCYKYMVLLENKKIDKKYIL